MKVKTNMLRKRHSTHIQQFLMCTILLCTHFLMLFQRTKLPIFKYSQALSRQSATLSRSYTRLLIAATSCVPADFSAHGNNRSGELVQCKNNLSKTFFFFLKAGLVSPLSSPLGYKTHNAGVTDEVAQGQAQRGENKLLNLPLLLLKRTSNCALVLGNILSMKTVCI